MNKPTIYICGDSMSVVDSQTKKYHWCDVLKNEFSEFTIKNLAFAGASNFAITAQIEKAISDSSTKLVLVNATDIYRINIPSKSFNRASIPIPSGTDEISENSNAEYWYDTIARAHLGKIYTEYYHNKLMPPEKLIDIFVKNLYEDTRLDPRQFLVDFGLWSVSDVESNSLDRINDKITKEVLESARSYYKHIFNVNQRLYEDVAMLEGKLYKMHSMNIPFLYSLGGLTSTEAHYYTMFPETITRIDKIYGLDKYYSDINVYGMGEACRKRELHLDKSPACHFKSAEVHDAIASYFIGRFNEILRPVA